MKYRIIFELEELENSWAGGERLDEWEKETVVPRVGDAVFLKKVGWKTVASVNFSSIEKKRRIVLISIKR